MKGKKAILIVLDSVGIGEAPDSGAYGDAGADTLGHIWAACHPAIPNMMSLGLGNVQGAKLGGGVEAPKGCFGKCLEVSAGKDTTTGHWEIAGVQLKKAFPTFPDGFPQDFIEAFEKAVGRGTLGNKPASGTAILDELGEEHLATGKLIVYTSADSVFQIAANEDMVPPQELYRICRIAREMLKGDLEVGRVIARPFVGTHAGAFKRTGNRRDFSALPPTTCCDVLAAAGKTVYGIGKIEDIFAEKGITKSNHAAGNPACIEATLKAMEEEYEGLLFVNLVDFDSVYGHRRDVKGYAEALEAFDRALPEIQKRMGPEDLLMLTADHGCDPTYSGTDHTREYIPIVAWGQGFRSSVDLGVRGTYADISATVLDYFGLPNTLCGTSFLPELRG
ncbi:MAG: phosphopentomutase [Clostridia bacterium]|nr:phosphopentomutase [Clostridia bacterium]